MSNFVVISKEQFESYLPDGFKEIEVKNCNERVYQGPSEKSGVEIRIYSSVDVFTDKTRDVGSDAIRIVFWDSLNDRPLGKGRRIYRVEGGTSIGDRIKERINTFMNDSSNQEVVDFEYVRAVLNSHAVNWMEFAQSLLQSLEDFGSLTENQLAYVLGEKTPKGKPTMEARAKQKDPDFVQKYIVKSLEDDSDEEFDIEKLERLAENHDKKKDQDSDPIEEPEPELSKPEEPKKPKGLVSTKDYAPHEYPFPFFNPVQSEVVPHIPEDKNMIVGANTSAGKTICAELIMDHVLKGEKVIYLSPLKSLTQEKYSDWQKRFPDQEITILTGDYVLSEKMKEKLAISNIIVMTSEMCDSRTRKMKAEKNYWLRKVGLVIVDESHILTTSRGHAVETGIMRFTSINPRARILFLSATMPNCDELGEWLTSLNKKETTIIFSTWRPVELQISYEEYKITFNSKGYEDYWASQDRKRSRAVEIALSKPDEKFLIFCHDKNTGRDVVRRLKNEGVESIFHNADLDLEDRLGIEESFQNRENGIRVLVSTSTLAWGRNLPARNVIIVGVHRGINEVDELDIIQMAGRAGRYGIDDAGFVYLIIPEGSTDVWVDIFQNPRPVHSVLNDRNVLSFHILAEVENKVITSIGTLMDWYKRSLAGKQQIIPFDKETAESLIVDLIEMEMLKGDPLRFSITGLGRVSAWLYFRPDDIFAWYRNFGRMLGAGQENRIDIDDENIAWAVADIPSRDPGFISRDLISKCDPWIWKFQGKGIRVTDAVPSVIAVHNALTGQEKDPMFDVFKRAIVFDIDRQCQALSLIDSMYAEWKSKDLWTILPLRIKYGVPNEMVELVKIPGIGGTRAKKLWDRGFKSLADVANDEKENDLLKVFKISMVKKIRRDAKKLLNMEED